MTIIDLPSDLFTAARCCYPLQLRYAVSLSHAFSLSRRSFRTTGVFKLAQTCQALHEATAPERCALSGRVVVYTPPVKSMLAYMLKYMCKEGFDARHQQGQAYVLLSRVR